MRKSEGHIAWMRSSHSNGAHYEIYEQGGNVYLASVSNAFDLNGYRHGRWECTRTHFDRFREQYLIVDHPSVIGQPIKESSKKDA